MTTTYHFDAHVEDGQWVGIVRDVDGAHTFAEDLDGLHRNIREVIRVTLDLPDDEEIKLEMHRSIERIPDILARLQGIWEQLPDYRLAQLMQLASRDPYYLEDDELLDRIEAQLKPVDPSPETLAAIDKALETPREEYVRRGRNDLRANLEAMFRLLEQEGHMTPVATRQLKAILNRHTPGLD